MATYASVIGRRRRRAPWHGRLLVAALSGAVAALACAPVAYMLWPRPAPIPANAPSLPITVGGVLFNVPPAAIRVKMQRRPGPQPRLDLMFAWPALTPPDAARPTPHTTPDVTDRLFITIAPSDGIMPPAERLKVIYPRYVGPGIAGPDGLTVQRFRDGSPYHGEDLMFDPAMPERFLLRCTQQVGATPAMCLHERRTGGVDISVRFPRQWLSDWRSVSEGIERLIASFRPQVP
jgi:hypothetical protein